MKLHNQRILVCKGRDADELGNGFVRLQEFFESPYPEIRGKYFTLAEYKKLYKEKHDGVYSYNKDWCGFNIPGHVVVEFFNVFGDDLSTFEKQLRHRLSKSGLLASELFYVIGYPGTDQSVMLHELAHAYFYVYPAYRRKMLSLVQSVNKISKKKMRAYLVKDYAEESIPDEMHAYMATDNASDFNRRFQIAARHVPWNAMVKVQETFEEYRNKYPVL